MAELNKANVKANLLNKAMWAQSKRKRSAKRFELLKNDAKNERTEQKQTFQFRSERSQIKAN